MGLDFTVFREEQIAQGPARPVMAAVVLVCFVALGGGVDRLGLRLRPLPNGRFWRRAFGVYLGACVALIALVGLAYWIGDWPLRSAFTGEWRIRGGCIHAPITEESIYRVALCAPLAAWLGPWKTVVLSGVVFGYLHVLWGNFEWNQPFGGMLNAWAYLRSGRVWVPIALHALSKMLWVAVHAALFYAG